MFLLFYKWFMQSCLFPVMSGFYVCIPKSFMFHLFLSPYSLQFWFLLRSSFPSLSLDHSFPFPACILLSFPVDCHIMNDQIPHLLKQWVKASVQFSWSLQFNSKYCGIDINWKHLNINLLFPKSILLWFHSKLQVLLILISSIKFYSFVLFSIASVADFFLFHLGTVSQCSCYLFLNVEITFLFWQLVKSSCSQFLSEI